MVNTKKVLLIAYNPLDIIGGMEKYNNSLVDILRKNFPGIEIHIAVTSNKNVKRNFEYHDGNIIYHFFDFTNSYNNLFSKYLGHLKEKRAINNFILNLEREFKFQLIINSTYLYIKNISNLENFILIQHNDPDIYLKKIFRKKTNFLKFITNIYLRFFEKSMNIIKMAKNIVVFDEKNFVFLRKYTKAKLYTISLFSDYENYKVFDETIKKRERILYLGRISKQDKRTDLMIQINDKIKLIDFFGKPSFKGSDKLKNILLQRGYYAGYSSERNEIFRIISEHKFMIIYSDYEGFPFSLVEALSLGVPIIVKNNFVSASFLCNDKTGLLLNNKSDLEEDSIRIKKFYEMSENEYEKYVQNCRNFYNENLKYQIFEEKWTSIFKKFLN